MVFNNHYKDACASSGSFNDYITAALYYGIIFFPLLIILSITTIIRISTDERQSQAAVPHQQLNSDMIAPLNEAAPPVPALKPSNVYKKLAQRISASFK